MDAGESPEEAVSREVKEVRVVRWGREVVSEGGRWIVKGKGKLCQRDSLLRQ